MQAFYDAIAPRAEDGNDLPRQLLARRAARRGDEPAAPPVLDDPGVVPRRGAGANRAFPTPARPRSTASSNPCRDRHRSSSRGRIGGSTSTPARCVRPRRSSIEGNRIVAVEPGEAAAGCAGDRPRRRHAAARPHGHGAELPHRRPRDTDRAAAADARRAGRPAVPDAAGDASTPEDTARRLHDRSQPRSDGQDRGLPARRRAAARRSTRAGTTVRASSPPATRSRRTAATSTRRCSSGSRPGSCR